MKNIISYLGLNQVVIRSRYSRFDSLSLVSRQSVLAIIAVCLLFVSGNVWGDETYTLINQSTGAVNTTDFFTGSSTTNDATGKTIADKSDLHYYIAFSNTASPGNYNTDRYIQYDVKTTSTTLYVYFYNGNSSASPCRVQEIKEGTDAFETLHAKSPKKQTSDTIKHVVSNTTNSTIYITVGSTNVVVYQVIAVESGEPLKKAGEGGYALDFVTGRVALKSGSDGKIDGIELVNGPGSSYTAASGTTYEISRNVVATKHIKFTTPASPGKLKLTWSGGQMAYNTSASASGATNITSETEYTLSGSSTYYLINTGNAKSSLTKLEFVEDGGDCTSHSVNLSSSGSVTGGTFATSSSTVCEGSTATLTATPATGYEFTSWSATGTGCSLSSTTTNPTTLTMGTADVTVSATFSAASYTVTLNSQSATTAGTGSVTARYNASTNLTSAIDCPTKTGYVFAGYFTGTNGTGVQLIDYAGNWIASAGGGSTYLDGSKNWKNAGALTLYACWMNYANSLDLQTYVETVVGSSAGDKTQSTDYSILSSNNYFYLLNTASSSTCLDNSDNAAYRGLKFKRSGDYVLFLVPANYSLSVKFGYVKTTKPIYSINGGAESSFNTISLASDNQSVDMGSETYDRLVKIKAADGDAAVLKTVTITSDGCPAFSFHTGGSDVWNTHEDDNCFTQIGETKEWRIDDYTRPNHTHYVVNWQSGTYSTGGDHSASFASHSWDDMSLALARSAKVSEGATGVQGSLRIYADSYEQNLYVGFIPAGYTVRLGANNYAATGMTSSLTESVWKTDVVKITSSNSSSALSVGLKTSSGSADYSQTKSVRQIFFQPNSNWKTASAEFWIYFWGTENDWGDDKLIDPDGDGIYEGWIPSSGVTKIEFVRINPDAATKPEWGDGVKWNSSGQLDLDGTKNLWAMTASADNWGAGAWSQYDVNGKFRIWADNAKKNFHVHLWPHYVVSFAANEGTGSMAEQSIAIDDADDGTITLTANSFEKTGYNFTNWETSAAVTADDVAVAVDGDVSDEAVLSDIESDITLTAQWSPITYTITLDKGTQGAANQSATVDYDATTVKSITHVTATGYDLTGYFDGETKVLNADGTFAGSDITGYITSGKWSKADNCTLTAKWTAQTYTITYRDKDDEDFSGVHIGSQPTSHTYNKSTTLKSASKSGFVFGGWYDNSSCTGDALTSIGKTAYTADFTLYAKWTEMSLVDLESGELYTASDMVPAGVSLTSSYQYYPGVSADQRFNVIGTGKDGSAETAPMGAKNENNTYDETAFTEVMNFNASASPSDNIPAHHALQFKIPAAGQLEIWINSKTVYLSNGTTEYEVDAVHKTLDVTAGTWYLYAKNNSKKLGGLRYTKTHSVTAVTSTGDNTKGSVSADPTVVAEGSTSTITAEPATGYQVTNWAVSGTGASISPSGSSSSLTTTLTMGTADATVTVTFGAIDYTVTHSDPTGDGTYTISVAGGDPTDENTTANYGQTITLAATPNDGYVLDSWTVTGATSGEAITVTSNQFTMPAEGVTVTATFVIPCTAVAAPASLTCSAQTPNTLTYTWPAASNASSYDVYLYSDEGCTSPVTPTEGSPYNVSTTSATLTGLTASTTYYCKVKSKGNGSTYCENGGTTSAQSGTTTDPSIIYNANLDGTSGSTTAGTSTEAAKACGYSKSGYKFKWWNTADNGSGEDFYVGESVTLGGSDVNLYAQWETVGSGWAYWVGDVAISSASTAYDVTGNNVTMQITRESNADWNTGLTDNWTIVSKYDGTTSRHAKVLAVDADNSYIEINFKDGSTINDLYLGITSDQTDAQNFVVCYSTTADFSSGAYEFVKVGSTDNVVSVPGHDQATKSTTRVKPSTADKYKYVRIYRKLTDGTGYNGTGADLGCSNKARIYSIKAQKGTASYTVTYADGGATSGTVPEDDTEYAEGDEVTVLGNTGSLTKTEYTFGGWSDGVTTYAAGDKFDMPASDVTLTAVWIINQYNVAVANVGYVTITATPAGGSAISEGNNANVDYGKSVTLAYSSLESGNYWGGWKVTKNSDGSDVTASVVDGNTLTVPAYAVTVSAVTYGDLVVWCDPDITITGDIHLTSVNGVSVYATSTTSNLIRIQSNDLAGVNKLGIKYLDADDNVITGSDRLFRLCDDGTPNYNVVDSKDTAVSTTCDLYFSISYTPNAYDQLDYCKLQIEMKRTGGRPNKVVTHDLYGRSLPEEFVIATKGNDGIWYALPNTIVDNSSAVAPIRITVDNETTPTAASYAPNTTVYKGDGRYNAANRYGVRFTDGVLKDSKLNHLQISSSTSTHYPWLSYTGSNTNQDWWLKSTDFSAYELNVPTSDATSAYKLGIYGGNIGYFSSVTSGSIFLLPITNKYTDIPATATEWGQHSVILAANPGATATKARARIEGGSPTEDQTISAINAAMGTAKNVKVPVGDIDLADLANNEGKLLYIDWYNSSSTLLGTSCVTIPRIIAANRNMKTDGEPLKNAWTDKEVHVLPGFTLTANTSDYATNPGTATIKELHIYPGATLNVSTGTLTATTLRLHNGWTRAGEKQYNTARVYINATNHAALAKGTASMDYDIYELTDGKHYYPLAVPFETSVSSIDYADSYLAGFSTYGTHYGIKDYNGARRAVQGPDQANNWSLVADDATLQPGKGYIMTAVAVKGEAIIRIPLTYNDAWTADGEKGTASYGEPEAEHTKNVVAVTAHKGTAATANKSNAGWNMLGVPFMSCYSTNEEAMTDGTTTEFINGRLILTGDPSSPLAFDDTDENIYVNVPTHDFSEYLQTEIDEATLLPGWCFMVQIGTSGDLTFLTSAQAESSSTPIYAPRRERAEMPVEKTGIILSGGEASDKTTILVSDKYSAADYEINADLEKLFGNGYTLATYSLSGETRLAYNAMSTSDATAVIPIGYRAPAEGEYTFSINPRYAESGAFSRVDLIDYETSTVTNLLYGPYTFESDRTQDDARFALNVVMAPQTPTDIESISDEGLEMSGAHKMIIDEKLYIILDGKMYDATGKVVKGGKK